jgi:5-methylcytosine-specific restriction endonuclease McrA
MIIMPKKPKIKTVKRRLNRLIHEILVLRDGCCQYCGRTGDGLHASHVMNKGRWRNLEFDLINLKLLCYKCHINWWHKEPKEPADWFIAKWPHRWKYLMEKRDDAVGFKVDELLEIEVKLKQVLEGMKNE